MANSLPVLTIDIDEEKLKRLEEVAKKFSEAFQMMPSGKVAPKLSENADKSSVGSTLNATNPTPSSTPIMGKALESKSVKEVDKSLKQLNKTLKETVRISTSLFKTALSWGTKLAAFSTIGAGGLGFLTYRAGESLKSAQGLGISVTEKQAITSSLSGRVSGIEGVVNNLNAAKYDVNSPIRGFLQSQGINYNQSPYETLFPTLRAALKVLNQHESAGAGLNALNAMGLNLDSSQASQLKALEKSGGLDRYEKEVNSRSRYFGRQISDQGFGNYQSLMSTFSSNAYKISNSFLAALNNLTPSLTKFSDAITEGLTKFISGPNGEALFKAVGGGLEHLAKWLGSEDFQKDLTNFIDLIGKLVRAISKAVSWVGNIFGESPVNKKAARSPRDPFYDYQFVLSEEARENFNQKPFFLRNSLFDYLAPIVNKNNEFSIDPYHEFSKNSSPVYQYNSLSSNQKVTIIIEQKPGSDLNAQVQSQIAG